MYKEQVEARREEVKLTIATFKRELSNKGNLRSVLDSTKFYPVGSVSTPSEEESLL